MIFSRKLSVYKKNRLIIAVLLLFLLELGQIYGQVSVQDSVAALESARHQNNLETLRKYGLPVLKDSGQTIYHTAMVLNYNETHEQANWVEHMIDPLILLVGHKRSNNFRDDPKVKNGSAGKDDYLKSGYDRGHLAPAADFKWSAIAMSESFYYSNMSPQKPELNRGHWNDLEESLRKYVEKCNCPLFVVTGPVLKSGLKQIGPNQVSVPERYYKVVADFQSNPPRGIAFIMPNEACPEPVFHYAVTIDSVERLVGINFFSKLKGKEEKQVESIFTDSLWAIAKKPSVVMERKKLPAGALNTNMLEGKENTRVTVCGEVVNVKENLPKGIIYVDVDEKHPNQRFTAQVKIIPEEELNVEFLKKWLNKQVCFTGLLSFDGKKYTMEITSKASLFECNSR